MVVIERRALIRDCLARCLEAATGQTVVAVASVEDWLAISASTGAPSLFVFCVPGSVDDHSSALGLDIITQAGGTTPTVVLSDADDVDRIFAALDKGVRGFISTNLTLDVAIEAMRLVNAGGVFVPAASLLAARRSVNAKPTADTSETKTLLTERQAAIVEALRRGKANKVIAYELKMRESTVKVHVRNIMKKLKAKNRTEVAYIASELLGGPGGAPR